MNIFIIASYYLYKLIILGTCAYAVFWLDRSGWWFLLALLLCSGELSVKTTRNNKDEGL